jgi:diadenylate cyclase
VRERLRTLVDSADRRDFVEIAILAVVIYAVLRFLRRTRGAGIVRGLGLIGIGIFLVAQLIIARFDLTELGKLLDSLLATAVIGLLVIFQPELRRGLMILGQYRGFRLFASQQPEVADRLATTALALSRDRLGALIAIQREQSLAPYIETGERIDSHLSPGLLRAIFCHQSPLHDGAVILSDGRVTAAACQLPLAQPAADAPRTGMRHRAALGLSDETDAVLLVVSEETGRVSLAVGGVLEAVPRENLSRRLAAALSASPASRLGGKGPRLFPETGVFHRA